MTNAKDAGSKDTGFGRRTFLEMATAAGAAPLAPALLGAGAASAQTAPAHHEETNHETERLAAYAAKLRYEELPPRPGAAHQRGRQEQHSRLRGWRRAGGSSGARQRGHDPRLRA